MSTSIAIVLRRVPVGSQHIIRGSRSIVRLNNEKPSISSPSSGFLLRLDTSDPRCSHALFGVGPCRSYSQRTPPGDGTSRLNDDVQMVSVPPVQIKSLELSPPSPSNSVENAVLKLKAMSSPLSSSSSSSDNRDASGKKDKNGSGSTPPILPLPSRRKRVRKFFVFKFFDFVMGYNKVLEKKFPGAMQVYRVFTVGVKDFAKELADYLKLLTTTIITPDFIRRMSSSELDLYYRMPKEIVRVAPTLLISALPFMNYIMFPIAYYFPKRLLSTHFWSIQQKSQFAIEFHKQRLVNFRPVFRSLQAHLELVRDPSMYKKCQNVLDKLGSGIHPSTRDIMDIKPLFESDPYSLKAIYGPHVKGLCRMHGIHTWYLSRWRLRERAEMLHIMDTALTREGIFNLKTDELKTACFLRGLNAANASHNDLMEYLQQWCSISSTVNTHSYSLLLHLPILIGYNNPNNWALLV